MPSSPLAARIEYAILALVVRGEDEKYAGTWGDWEAAIRELAAGDMDSRDVLSGIKDLWKGGLIQLTDPGDQVYSGDDVDDETFFFSGVFKATATAAGGDCWDGIIFKHGQTSGTRTESPWQ